LTLEGLKDQEIEIEVTNVYGNEALKISAIKKWRMHFLQGTTEPGDCPRSRKGANSDLTQMIAGLI
jgi:hypothetical protein